MNTIKEKRDRLKKYATRIGLCNRCMFKEKTDGKKSCATCRKNALIQANKYRVMPTRCSRCGQNNTRHKTHKTCLKCLEYARKSKLLKTKK